MSASLVGSEMCIRDRRLQAKAFRRRREAPTGSAPRPRAPGHRAARKAASRLHSVSSFLDMFRATETAARVA
eukprot:3322192-Alexandrium_andersonii.AAC.1